MNDDVSLRLWTIDDLPVLERSNTPQMTAFLGGPETREQLVARHAKYIRLVEEGTASMFTIWAASEHEPVGAIGYWKTTWANDDVYETGWSIATRYQGRGFASRGLRECLHHAATFGNRQNMLAFPRIDNAASNSLCESAGFVFRSEEAFEYPRGNPIRVNAWSYDLTG